MVRSAVERHPSTNSAVLHVEGLRQVRRRSVGAFLVRCVGSGRLPGVVVSPRRRQVRGSQLLVQGRIRGHDQRRLGVFEEAAAHPDNIRCGALLQIPT